MILVTGGTGFIGRHLVARLAEAGREVRLLARPRSYHSPSPVSRSPVHVVVGDIGDSNAVLRAAAGAETVYHLAAYARAWAKDPRTFYDVNVTGTEHVCGACRAHGARLVHVSTSVAADRERLVTHYQRSKALAEDAVRAALPGRAVIVRPTRVYGPGPLNQANSATRMIDAYRRGWFRVRIADGDARGNWVYVGDVVEGMVLAGQDRGKGKREEGKVRRETGSPDPRAAGSEMRDAYGDGGTHDASLTAASDVVPTYELGGEDATLTEFLSAVDRVTGTGPRCVVPLPRRVVKGVAGVAELLGRLGVEPVITRDWVDLLAMDWPVSSERARCELGYAPRSIAEGVRDTLAWLETRRAPRPAHRAPRSGGAGSGAWRSA